MAAVSLPSERTSWRPGVQKELAPCEPRNQSVAGLTGAEAAAQQPSQSWQSQSVALLRACCSHLLPAPLVKQHVCHEHAAQHACAHGNARAHACAEVE